jgi:hypothetical protein
MLETMPYADLLAVYNAIAEKPVTRFDTRANGVRRAEALLETRGLTLPEAARVAQVVLPGDERIVEPPAADKPDRAKEQPLETGGAHDLVQFDPTLIPDVNAFVRELLKPERERYVATFLLKLHGAKATRTAGTRQPTGMTLAQRAIVALCSRPQGATAKELAEGCGWPTIAARATCQKLADRFGYVMHEKPKAEGRGITFYLSAKPVA